MHIACSAVAHAHAKKTPVPNSRGRRFFLPTNKTFEEVCLALAGKFLQKELDFFL